MKEKIGMITCFLDNYGACLQGYALQSKIEQLGYKVEILQYVEPIGYDNNRRNRIEELIIIISRWVRALLFRNYRKTFLFSHACSSFKKQYLHLSKNKMYSYDDVEKASLEYGTFVCGSDQIWNPTFYNGPNRVYYLNFAGNKKRIAYAPSIGVNDINEEYRNDFSRMVTRFNYISVREKTGCDLVKRYTGRDARQVLDPTLLVEGEDWKKLADRSKSRIVSKSKSKKYIFCYLFGDWPLYYEFIDAVKRLLNVEVYMIPFNNSQKNKGYNLVYGAGPIEFVSMIARADLVITDSFHATALSIDMNVPFYTLLRDKNEDKDSMNSRILDILDLFGLRDRLWDEKSNYNSFTIDIDWSNPNRLIQQKRLDDLNFLKGAIS